ncbi:MAG TPA: hypothetical protein VHA35_14310 [Dongiaceae bacterium]|jgi:hypothetical protein|nr:hypothetical protein [Dongiaceae bacterium]
MMKAIFGTAALAALVLTTGMALACPYDKSAQSTDQQQTTASSDLPLPTGGAQTETKTGG